jgi:hypothetical protein
MKRHRAEMFSHIPYIQMTRSWGRIEIDAPRAYFCMPIKDTLLTVGTSKSAFPTVSLEGWPRFGRYSALDSVWIKAATLPGYAKGIQIE